MKQTAPILKNESSQSNNESKTTQTVIGVIYLDNSLIKGVFSSEDIDILNAIASQISTNIAIENQKNELLLIEKAKSNTLRRMAAGVAHEVNNPLAIISGNAEIGSVRSSKAVVKKHFQTIGSNVKRLAKIIENVRELTLESYTRKSHAATSVKKILSDYARNNCQSLEAVKFDFEAVSESISVDFHSSDCEKVLSHLIENSIFAIRGKENPKIRISSRTDNSRLILRVFDSGGGISPQIQSNMFLPFFTAKPIGTGVGLGLTVAKHLAEVNRGTLAYSGDSTKTEFALSIPLSK